MKNVLAPKNNWALTATLLAVVGLNASFKPQELPLSPIRSIAAEGEAAKASETAKPEEVKKPATDAGKEAEKSEYVKSSFDSGKAGKQIQVTYRTTSNGVDATVEGLPNCDTCKTTVNIRNGSIDDIARLNKEISKIIGVPQTEKTEVQVAKEEEKKKDPFEGIETKCAKNKNKSDEIACTAKEFIAALKKAKKDEEIPKEDALEFYKTYIETTLLENMKESRNTLNQARRESLNMSRRSMWDISWDDIMPDRDAINDAHKLRSESQKVIRSLLAGLPKANEDIRKRLVLAQATMAKEEAMELQRTFLQARDSRDPATGLALFNEGNLRREDLGIYLGDMREYTRDGLSAAYTSRNLSSDTYQNYMRNINDTFDRLRSGMWTNPYGFAQNVDSYNPAGTNLVGRTTRQFNFPTNNPLITPLPRGIFNSGNGSYTGSNFNPQPFNGVQIPTSNSYRGPAPGRF